MLRRIGFLGVLLVSFICSGCTAPRINLRVPPKNAPEQIRRAAYKDLKPTKAVTRVMYRTVTYVRNGILQTERRRVGERNFLKLQFGGVIHNPEDLLPVVEANSVTARATKRYQEYRSKDRIFRWTGEVVLGVGTVFVLVRMIGVGGNAGPFYRDPLFVSGMGLAALGSVAFMIGKYGYQRRANAYKRKAFYAYHQDLRTRLGLGQRVKFRDLNQPAPKIDVDKKLSTGDTKLPANGRKRKLEPFEKQPVQAKPKEAK